MPLKLYLDENVDVSVASALRQRGVDVVTARDREKLGASDEEHLVQARAEGRVLVTHDIADFIGLHQRWVAAGTLHAGIALSNIIPPGALLRRLFRLCESMSEAEGHLIFLGADYR